MTEKVRISKLKHVLHTFCAPKELIQYFLKMSDFEDSPPETQKEDTKTTEEKTEADDKNEETEKKEEESTEIKPRKRRSTKFQPSSLTDKEKGIPVLYERLNKFKPDKYPTKKEAFHAMMRLYQRWAYRLYPGEFSDTCWKIANTSGTKTIVRNFIYEMNGGDPLIFDELHPEGISYFQKNQESDGDYQPGANGDNDEEPKEELENNEQQENTQSNASAKVDFFSSDDDDENESQTIPEILDLFASQRQ